MILPREQLKLEELALANSVKQKGAPGRRTNGKMVNGVDKKNHLSLCATAVTMLCLTEATENKNDTRCILDRRRGS